MKRLKNVTLTKTFKPFEKTFTAFCEEGEEDYKDLNIRIDNYYLYSLLSKMCCIKGKRINLILDEIGCLKFNFKQQLNLNSSF